MPQKKNSHLAAVSSTVAWWFNSSYTFIYGTRLKDYWYSNYSSNKI